MIKVKEKAKSKSLCFAANSICPECNMQNRFTVLSCLQVQDKLLLVRRPDHNRTHKKTYLFFKDFIRKYLNRAEKVLSYNELTRFLFRAVFYLNEFDELRSAFGKAMYESMPARDKYLRKNLKEFLLQAELLLPSDFMQRRRVTFYRFWINEAARREPILCRLLGGQVQLRTVPHNASAHKKNCIASPIDSVSANSRPVDSCCGKRRSSGQTIIQ
jgi:hypothetical protein